MMCFEISFYNQWSLQNNKSSTENRFCEESNRFQSNLQGEGVGVLLATHHRSPSSNSILLCGLNFVL